MKRVVLLALLLGAFITYWLFNNSPNIAPNQAKTTLRVTDSTGQTIQLPAPAQRIIALSPHLVENIYTAGAGDKLVGVVAFSNFPEAAKSLPIIGSYPNLNYEKIIALNPDLIMAWKFGITNDNLRRLTELGFTIYLDHPKKLTDIATTIQDIGILTQREEVATTRAENYLTRLHQLEKNFNHRPTVSVFYEVWNQPLQTINGTHTISDAIKLCGGMNIFTEEPAVAPIINIESILMRNPEVIITGGASKNRPLWLDNWQQWSTLKAVQQGNIFFVNPEHIARHTTRTLLGIETICQQLEIARNKRS